ncbi:hypothetical protein ABHN11_28025 [Brevibacillus centrosporus]|uniref:hypothetical protein n=1 Tax=Brevibacillus centrosporus TaxID=54910 RepID=UPI003D22E4A8
MKKKGLLNLLSILMLSLIVCSVASAATEKRGAAAFYSGGGFKNLSITKNIRYYATPEVKNYFGTYITNAINTWSSISGVDFGFTEIKKDGIDWLFEKPELMIFNSDNNPSLQGMGGIMIPCNWDSNFNCNTTSIYSRWDSSTVLVSKDYVETEKYTTANRRWLLVHEIGHMYALDHQDKSIQSVMEHPQGTISTPTSLDLYNLNWKY